MSLGAKIGYNPYQSLGVYWNKIYCKCPSCSGLAVVKGFSEFHFPPWPWPREIVQVLCRQCLFRRNWVGEDLYDQVIGKGRCQCPHCGYKWLTVEIKGNCPSEQRKKSKVECAACHRSTLVDIEWSTGWQNNNPVDPYFGYPLWLQISCCGKTLWAYNEAHLNVLKIYVGATLREGRGRHPWSMMTRLPQWIKSAKNRDAIMKALHRLEQKLAEKA